MSVDQVVWIARHGNRQDFVDPDWPLSASRPHDPGLSSDGLVQARELAQRLSDVGLEAVYCSPFLRTVQTAHATAEILDLPLRIERGTCEWLNPEWFRRAPDFLDPRKLKEDFPRVEPGYQSLIEPDFPEEWEGSLRRSGETARKLAGRHKGPILIVGHGASVFGMAWGLVSGRPYLNAALCALVKVVRRGGHWHLELDGDSSHLSEGEKNPLRSQ